MLFWHVLYYYFIYTFCDVINWCFDLGDDGPYRWVAGISVNFGIVLHVAWRIATF